MEVDSKPEPVRPSPAKPSTPTQGARPKVQPLVNGNRVRTREEAEPSSASGAESSSASGADNSWEREVPPVCTSFYFDKYCGWLYFRGCQFFRIEQK